VGLNALFLKPGKVGGTEEYVRRLLWTIEREPSGEVDVTLFANRRFARSIDGLASVSLVVAPISGDRPSIRIAMESSWLRSQSVRLGLDLVHHLGNTIPHLRARPAVVTVHDLQAIVRPGDFGPIKGRYLRGRLRRSARGAHAVTTPTEFVRRQVIDRFALDDSRVVAIPAPLMPPSRDDVAGSSLADRISSRFFLYPAMTHPHKNHVTLLRAFASLAATHGDVALVLTGGPGAADGDVSRAIDGLGVRTRVHRFGWVARRDLDGLLRRAIGLVLPSRHEGYGLPVSEAMAIGCPVIASNVTALPEVVGDAGLLVPPDDVGAWVHAMSSLLDSVDVRGRLIASGRRRVASLSPDVTARQLVELYRTVAASGRDSS
jgi:alpha-1,3-rhamnosyl/mannosyltransferase